MPDHADLIDVIRREGVRDPLVLRACREVDRRGFVPRDATLLAYWDRPVPIPHDQVTTQPSLVARMVEALGLGGSGRVLEIGTGLGYQTAILSRLADRVWSVERWEDLAEEAHRNLESAGVTNAEVVAGDGTLGLPDHAPYDGIVVSAAFPEVPEPLAGQLAEGGALVMPLGPGGMEDVVLFEKQHGDLVRRKVVTGAHFVRLYGEHAYRK